MIMPFRFSFSFHNDTHVTIDWLEELCHFTVEHAKDSSLKVEEARFLYERFINWIDKEIMVDDADWKKFRNSQT